MVPRLLKLRRIPVVKLLPEIEAMLWRVDMFELISNLLDTEAFPEKTQLPVTVSFCDSEAGPPDPQAKRINPSEAVLEKAK
jgi:hypothetical protein